MSSQVLSFLSVDDPTGKHEERRWVRHASQLGPALSARLALVTVGAMAALGYTALRTPGFFNAWGPALAALVAPCLATLPTVLYHATEGTFGVRPPNRAALEQAQASLAAASADVRLEALYLLAQAVESHLCALRSDRRPAHHVLSLEDSDSLRSLGVPAAMLAPPSREAQVGWTGSWSLPVMEGQCRCLCDSSMSLACSHEALDPAP